MSVIGRLHISLGPQKGVRVRKYEVSAKYSGIKEGNQSVPDDTVRIQEVSAKSGVRISQVLLYSDCVNSRG